jgi:hypothetical protein
MKKLVLTSLILAFNATMVMASDPIESPGQKLRNQIKELLESPNIEFESDIIQARINFTLNKKEEIVILSIDTENAVLDAYIKRKLNYRQVPLNGLTVGKEFQLNFKVKKNAV